MKNWCSLRIMASNTLRDAQVARRCVMGTTLECETPLSSARPSLSPKDFKLPHRNLFARCTPSTFRESALMAQIHLFCPIFFAPFQVRNDTSRAGYAWSLGVRLRQLDCKNLQDAKAGAVHKCRSESVSLHASSCKRSLRSTQNKAHREK